MTPTAADDPLILRAFRSLHPSRQAALCPDLAAAAGAAAAEPEPQPDADGSSEALARRYLCEAYLRTYTAEAPGRVCRHLTAVLDDTVRGGVSRRSDELDLHTRTCASCARARVELTTLHGGTLAEVATLLQRAADAGATGVRAGDGQGGLPAASAVAVFSDPTSRNDGRRRLRGVVAASPVGVAALTGVVVTALAATVLVFSATGPAEENRTPPSRTAATPPSLALPADAAPTSAAATTSAPPRQRTTQAPTRPARTTKPATAVVHTPAPPPTGFRLVNRSTGLCVGVEGEGNGAMLRLEDCTAAAWQRWETVDAGDGTQQLRNTGTHKCLDGTGNGGNVVRVVQNDCRDGASPERSTQLWRFRPEEGTTAFRLEFVPPVPASDYSDHLLGPEDWWHENPPRKGSYLAQLPNYYNSESFVFVRNGGT